MSIDAKHFYRFKYLRSDHWANLRLEKLASVDAKCVQCGARELSNDVHHLNYRNLYDVQLSDLVVLCRACHEKVHEALDRYRGKLDQSKGHATWGRTQMGLNWLALGLLPGETFKAARVRYQQSHPSRKNKRPKEKARREKMDRPAREPRQRAEAPPLPPEVRARNSIFRELRKSGMLSELTVNERMELACRFAASEQG